MNHEPPEPGMRYIGSLADLQYGGLETEIVAAAREGCRVVVTKDGVWWRKETAPELAVPREAQ